MHGGLQGSPEVAAFLEGIQELDVDGTSELLAKVENHASGSKLKRSWAELRLMSAIDLL